MAGKESMSQGETGCALTQEACHGRELLGREMGMGRQYGSKIQKFIDSFIFSLIHPIKVPMLR